MLNVEVLLPEFSNAVSRCIETKSSMMLNDIAFSEQEAELFGSAIKYCCNFRKVPMIVVGDLSQPNEISFDPREYDYNDVASLGKKVKELAKTHQCINLLPSDIADLCSNCGINI
jgi:hypothetical protein